VDLVVGVVSVTKARPLFAIVRRGCPRRSSADPSFVTPWSGFLELEQARVFVGRRERAGRDQKAVVDLPCASHSAVNS